MATQLVSIPEVERLSASVVRILAGNPGKFTLQGTNTYLVGRGRQRLLIDTGEGKPAWIATLRSVLKTEKATVSKALLTHWHQDHTGGVEDLSKVCPEATIYKNDADTGMEDIQDGQVFQVDGATLRAFHTPGHTEDHMAFVLEEENAMFTGDNVLGHGTAVFENLSAYLSSLEKMGALGTQRGYPGHGPVIDNCKAKISDYIQHRQQRESEVVRVLEYGTLDTTKIKQEFSPDRKPVPWDLMEIVKIIYHNVPENLHIPASHGINQVLVKLERDGKVIHDEKSGKWTLVSVRPAL